MIAQRPFAGLTGATAVLLLLVATGVLVVVEPVVAVAASAAAGVTAVALMRGRAFWWDLVVVALGGSLVLGYGFANLGLPGNVPLPLADLLLVALLLRISVTWDIREIGWKTPFVLAAALLAFATARLAVDFPVWGTNALRDYALPLEFGYLLVGYWSMREYGLARWTRTLGPVFAVAAAYFVLYPIQKTLAAHSPIVGLQRPVPLFGTYSHAGIAASLGLLCAALLRRPVRGALLAAAAFLFVLALDQSRGIYLALPAAALVVFIAGSARLRSVRLDLLRSLAVATVVVSALLAVVPFTGRIGQRVSLSGIQSQIGTLFGQAGAASGSGSINTRQQFIDSTMHHVARVPRGWLWGVGLGPDLTDGFRVVNNANVRKPHDDYLEAYARLGILGLSLFLGVLITSVTRVARAARRATNPDANRFLLWSLGGAVVILVVAATQPLLAFPYGTIPLFLPLGAALAVADADRPAGVDET
jgi:O-antigen ligase